MLSCSREKLERQARSGHKGVSALIWRKKRRKEEDRRGGGGGVMFFLNSFSEGCFVFISFGCVCLLSYLFVSGL